jgi:hypothetical protein
MNASRFSPTGANQREVQAALRRRFQQRCNTIEVPQFLQQRADEVIE